MLWHILLYTYGRKVDLKLKKQKKNTVNNFEELVGFDIRRHS